VPDEHLLVAADAQSMAEAVCRLVADDGLWRALSENGRALVRSRYLAEVAYRPLDEALTSASATA
jgi:glycosyltransferase involved in cell wall biosynthesis